MEARLAWRSTGAGLSPCPGKRTRPTRWRQGLTTGAGAEVTACSWVTAHEAAGQVLVSSSGHGAQESDPPLCPSTRPDLAALEIIPTPPTATQGIAEVRAEGTFSEAARHLETTVASCETDWLLAFAANKKQPSIAANDPAP